MVAKKHTRPHTISTYQFIGHNLMSEQVEKHSKQGSTPQQSTPTLDEQTTQDTIAPTLFQELSTASAPPLQPKTILQLQSLIGNQQVMRLIQRQEGSTPTTPLLTPMQIANARRLYEAQSRRYSPLIIQDIEGVIGRPQDGLIDDADVLAVATFQQEHPPLPVDGFAGPNTLPQMFPFGLTEQESIDEYTGEFAELRTEWRTITPAERLIRLRELIDPRLQDGGVTPAELVPFDFGRGRVAGQFDFQSWTIRIGQHLLSRDELQDADIRNLMQTVYHEARHAEQYFTIARWYAGMGQSISWIRAEMRFHNTELIQTMLQAAMANPVQPNTPEALMAQDWDTSFYGRDHQETDATYNRAIGRGRTLREAEVEHDLNPATPATEQREDNAQGRFDDSVGDYHNLPMENDTHMLEERVDESYSETTGRESDSAVVDDALEGTGL